MLLYCNELIDQQQEISLSSFSDCILGLKGIILRKIKEGVLDEERHFASFFFDHLCFSLYTLPPPLFPRPFTYSRS